jgi:hypothetical protein
MNRDGDIRQANQKRLAGGAGEGGGGGGHRG